VNGADTARQRAPYERPHLGKVKMAADEVLISGCKTVSQKNLGTSGLELCSFAGSCASKVGS
jgi:hypothetical protein